MNKKDLILNRISEQKILPLYFHHDPEISINVLKALYRAGIRIIEYTNRGQEALENFKKMRTLCDYEMKDMYLGIGTIKNRETGQAYMDAGADFIICPGLVEEVAEVADKNDMLWIPGCMTPSEIIKAENMGARMIKLFPGNLLGPEFMSSIKALFPNLMFMPTGGVSLDRKNLEGWFKSGVVAVGMGSKLLSKELLEEENYKKMEELTKNTLHVINSF